jgi:alpha-glucoside transport system permease protein
VSSSGTVAPGSVVARPPRRRLPSSLRGFAQALPFLSPALILVGAFLIVPVVWTVLLSLNRTRGLNFGDEWIGLDNYERLLTRDSRFLDTDEFPWAGAVINNLRWVIFYTGLCLLLGLVTAVLATRVNYERAFKAIIFVPMAISATAVAIIWLLVYSPDPQIGVLNALIGAVGGNPVSWTGRRDTVNYAIIVAYVWASTGFVMVVLSAALKGISEEVIEAARTDGATEWDIFRRIQLPLLSLPISVVAVWLIINVIKIFDIVYIMTKGGPGGASRVIGYSYYVETFENGKGGYGAAVAVIMLLLIIPIMAFNIRRFRSEAIQG